MHPFPRQIQMASDSAKGAIARLIADDDLRARMAASGLASASTERWRGAGNIAANDSWKPGRMLAS